MLYRRLPVKLNYSFPPLQSLKLWCSKQVLVLRVLVMVHTFPALKKSNYMQKYPHIICSFHCFLMVIM